MKLNLDYIPGPGGAGPLYWMHEQTGVLRKAMIAFFAAQISNLEMAPEQFDLVKAYCIYWMDAPCWSLNGLPEFAKAESAMRAANSRESLTRALGDLLEFGIDPI
jgi:hypothetical protein